MTELSRAEERRARAVDLAIRALGGESRRWNPLGVRTEVLNAAKSIDKFIEEGAS